MPAVVDTELDLFSVSFAFLRDLRVNPRSLPRCNISPVS
jgi:hypothetical protein